MEGEITMLRVEFLSAKIKKFARELPPNNSNGLTRAKNWYKSPCMSLFGTKRRFAATQQSVAFGATRTFSALRLRHRIYEYAA
jgi:hypothetical protein